MSYHSVEESDLNDLLETEEMDTNIQTRPLSNEISYYDELFSIMYAFGDVKEPLSSSVYRMYNILQAQMALLIKNAEDVMKLRKRKKISHEEVLFLMRKNKVLLKRLLLFLFVEDAKTCFNQGSKRWHKGFSPENGEKVSQCLNYLAFIEAFKGDLTSILRDEKINDLVKLKRLKRRDLMAESMTAEEYKSFCDYTLKTTFCQKYAKDRFLRWLQQCSCTTIDITPLALLIINFLARETVAGIIDKALEIKSRKFPQIEHFRLENFCDPLNVFHESKHELEASETNVQQPLSGASKDSSCYQNLENFPVDASEKNKIAESSIINSSLHCPVAIDRRERSMAIKSNSTGNLVNDEQEKGTSVMSTHLYQNSSSKSCASSKSDFSSDAAPSKRRKSDSASVSKKISLRNAKKNKAKSRTCDNVKYPNTSHVVDEGTSFECKSDKVFSDSHDTSEKVTKKHTFSLNFQEKSLSICYDGSKTFEIDANSAVEDKYNKTTDTEDDDFSSFCFVEYVEKSNLEAGDSDFDKQSRDLLIFPKETNNIVYWFPDKAITSTEIESAFIYYQQPLPISFFLKTDFPKVRPRKVNLVCLIDPDDFE